MNISQQNAPAPDNIPAGYKSLCKLAGVAAWLVAALTLVEVVVFSLFPPPDTVSGWFMLFKECWFLGLVSFWGLEIPMYLLFVPVFLALFVALRRTNESWVLLGLAFALLGSAIFLATNNPFTMLSLSRQYLAAATEAQRTAFLAAGETVLANTGQRAVGGFNLGLFLVSLAGLIFSLVMLKSIFFSRKIAVLGILAFGLSLADYLRQAFTTSVIVALIIILPNAVFLVIWFILIGRRLSRV